MRARTLARLTLAPVSMAMAAIGLVAGAASLTLTIAAVLVATRRTR